MVTVPSQTTQITSSLTWGEALTEYLLHVKATKAPKTLRFYDTQLRQAMYWADDNQVRFSEFGKRHLDRYLIFRQEGGKSPTTLKSDAVALKAFYRWCSRNDLIGRNPLAEYQIKNTPQPNRYMASDEEIRKLLAAMRDYWTPAKNKDVRYVPVAKRSFHRDRNYVVILGLLDTAARIGEMLNLRLADVREVERQITFRQTKGKVPRTVPVSTEWLDALNDWLKIRAKVMGGVADDEGFVFVSECGTHVEESRFLKTMKRYARWAGLSDEITLHSLRRYSLNRLAKTNLLATQQIAGHKETKTTLMYTKLDADFIRDVHDSVGIVRGMVVNKHVQRKRLI